ncbi:MULTISPECIES: neutral zinc metallopeptidase [Actinoalloteichus]|uniref:Metalloprotease n=1 Tax=Actinoalloteichus fjordicus TaxID=1612552 RepID=A0AAC9PQT5_9PSEU|nr:MULTISPECIES: neutral zinc metallopeptidase [Actinoalloteichus]APU13519.1 putative metalloprotease [Actinoalloteichus fjordicus]APU19468.1 putative metalloprotease [Actinoalloteichus sp. GBA129-24]
MSRSATLGGRLPAAVLVLLLALALVADGSVQWGTDPEDLAAGGLGAGSVAAEGNDTGSGSAGPGTTAAEAAGAEVDRLADAAVEDLLAYWAETFEPAFALPWVPPTGGLHAADGIADVGRKAPPCLARTTEIAGSAYYCESADALVWDRGVLLPVLAEDHGPAGVTVVLAHELGHRVHTRLGVDDAARRTMPERYPVLLSEAMADCYAGTYFRWAVDGGGASGFTTAEVDDALAALVRFRDPIVVGEPPERTHGGALDRVLAFHEGYSQGARRCAALTTQDLAPPPPRQDRPLRNRPLAELSTEDLGTYFADLAIRHGGHGPAPVVRTVAGDPDCGTGQGPVAFCPAEPAVVIGIGADGDLAEVNSRIGDHAAATMVAGRHALAATTRLGLPIDDPTAGRRAVCLVGAWSAAGPAQADRTEAAADDGQGRRSAHVEEQWWGVGDLDEAVLLLLADDQPARDVTGFAGDGSGLQRVLDFAAGRRDGAADCLRR